MEYVRLGDLYSISKGKKVEELEIKHDAAIRYIQIEDLRNNNNLKYCLDTDKYVKVTENDIIIAWDGANAGTIGYGLKGAIGSTLAALKTDSQDIYTKYIGYYLSSKSQYLRDKCTGATIPHIQRSILESIKIPLLSLEEQIKVSNILDQAQELIDKRKAQIEALDELIQSVFNNMFGDVFLNRSGWKECFLEELCEEIVDCPHSTPIYSEGVTQYPCIRTSEISNGYIKWDSMKYLDEEEYFKRVKRLIPKPGDVVYAREGTFGDAIIIPNSTEMCLGQRVMLFRTKSDVNAVFFWGMIRSNGVYHQALNNTSGSTVGHVNIKDIKKFKCLVVPLELQNKFAEIVESIEKQKELLNESLVELEDNFNSLMQRVFKGQLF